MSITFVMSCTDVARHPPMFLLFSGHDAHSCWILHIVRTAVCSWLIVISFSFGSVVLCGCVLFCSIPFFIHLLSVLQCDK